MASIDAVRDRRGLLRVVLVIIVVLVLLLALALVAGLTFSVRVQGDSMQPTLRSGDRLEIDLLHRTPDRFSLVEAAEPAFGDNQGGARIVKRVIGLPGDRVAVAGGVVPTVYVRPAGSDVTYVVDNPTWSMDRNGDGVPDSADTPSSCCTSEGTSRIDGRRSWATVPVGDYWLIGDNWGGSTDSRVFGFVPASDIQATLGWRILPWGRQGHVPEPARLVPEE